MSRAKLKSLGIDLPIFPTSTVGSFPKPDYLVEARAKFAKGKIDRKALDELDRTASFVKMLGSYPVEESV